MSSVTATAATTQVYQGEALLVCDWEVTGHGRDKTRNRIIGGAMCVIEMDMFRAQCKVGEPIKDEAALLALIPVENRFREYVHDKAALVEIEPFAAKEGGALVGDKGIWSELPGREFWLAPRNRAMLERTVGEMQASKSDARAFTEHACAWLDRMVARYPNLLPVSDTSNFDGAWFDHYRNEHGVTTVNFANPTKGCVMSVDATSYYFGLLGHPGSFAAWDNFSSNSELRKAGFLVPDTKAVLDMNLHDPLIDAMHMGIKFAAVSSQAQARSAAVAK
jgi:hypothetical protein